MAETGRRIGAHHVDVAPSLDVPQVCTRTASKHDGKRCVVSGAILGLEFGRVHGRLASQSLVPRGTPQMSPNRGRRSTDSAVSPPCGAGKRSAMRFGPPDQERFRISAEAANGPQCDMADNAGNAEVRIVDQLGGEGFVFAKIGANESCQVIELAAHLPTFDDLLDSGQAPLEATAMRLLFQD